MKMIAEETAATQVPAADEQPEASKKATGGVRGLRGYSTSRSMGQSSTLCAVGCVGMQIPSKK
jgi:hypothetical protein